MHIFGSRIENVDNCKITEHWDLFTIQKYTSKSWAQYWTTTHSKKWTLKNTDKNALILHKWGILYFKFVTNKNVYFKIISITFQNSSFKTGQIYHNVHVFWNYRLFRRSQKNVKFWILSRINNKNLGANKRYLYINKYQ